MAVVLPAPLGPSTPSTSPRRTSRSRSSSASTGPYRCVTRERLARAGLCVTAACIGPAYEPAVGAVSGEVRRRPRTLPTSHLSPTLDKRLRYGPY